MQTIDHDAHQAPMPATCHSHVPHSLRVERALALIPPPRLLALNVQRDTVSYATIPDMSDHSVDTRRVRIPTPADGFSRASCLIHRDGVHVIAVRTSCEIDPNAAEFLGRTFVDPLPGFIAGTTDPNDIDHLVMAVGGKTTILRLANDADQRLDHLTVAGDLVIGVRRDGNATFINTFFVEALAGMLKTAKNPGEILLDDMGVEMPLDIASDDLFLGRPVVTRGGDIIFPLAVDNEHAHIVRIVRRPNMTPHIQIRPSSKTSGFRPIGLLDASASAPFVSTKGRVGETNAFILESAEAARAASPFAADFYTAFETM